jgi:hypothetical protein
MISLFLAGMCLVNDEFPGVQSRLLLDFARRPRGENDVNKIFDRRPRGERASRMLSFQASSPPDASGLLDSARRPRGENASRTKTSPEDLAGSAPRKENFAGAVLDIV